MRLYAKRPPVNETGSLLQYGAGSRPLRNAALQAAFFQPAALGRIFARRRSHGLQAGYNVMAEPLSTRSTALKASAALA